MSQLLTLIQSNPVEFLIVVLALLIFFVLYSISKRTNKVNGSLLFIDGNVTIVEFSLYNGTNVRVIGKKELRNYPQLFIKRVRISNIVSPKRSNKVEPSDFGTNDSFNQIRVEVVSYNRAFEVVLYPHTPTIYSNETMAQMLYKPAKW